MSENVNQNSNNVPDLSSMQERNQQLLSDIKNLQDQEQNLYDELQEKASAQTLTDDQKSKIVKKINEIYQIRLNLYSNLKDTYTFYEQNVSSSQTTLSEQKNAVDIIENQLKIERGRLAKLEEEKYNKLRLVEFNSSYASQYAAQTRIMKTIAFWCLPVILFIVLTNQEILSQGTGTFLISLTILIGLIIVIKMTIDSLNRDNMNYNEYNWYFNPDDVDKDTSLSNVLENSGDSTSSENNPWQPILPKTCVGQACCNDGYTYSSDTNKCELNDTTNTITDTTTNSTSQESFVGNHLAKYAMQNSSPNNTLIVSDKVEAYSNNISNYVSV